MAAAREPRRFDLATPSGRLRTYWDFLFQDHAVLRLAFRNAHWVSEDLVRTNQPWPHQLADWKAKETLSARQRAAAHPRPDYREVVGLGA